MKNILFFILFILGCNNDSNKPVWYNSQYDYGNICFENAKVVKIEYSKIFHLFGDQRYNIVFEWKYGKFYLYDRFLYPNQISEGDCVVIKYQEIFKNKELYCRNFLRADKVECK